MRRALVLVALISQPALAQDVDIGLNLQTRWVGQFAFDPGDGADATEGTGFRIRRAAVTGRSEFGPACELRFKMDLARTLTFVDAEGESRDVLRPVLDDAQLVLWGDNPVSLSVGQYKVPFSLQSLTQDRAVVFPERAVSVDGLKNFGISVSGLGFGRDIGASVEGKVVEDKLSVWASVFGGDGPNVWPPKDDLGNLYVLRVVATPMGKVALDEADLEHGPSRIALGVSAAFDHNADAGTLDGRFAADARWMSGGLAFVAEGELATAISGEDVDPAYGFHSTVSYAISSLHLLPAARFSLISTEEVGAYAVEASTAWLLPSAWTDDTEDLGHRGKLVLAWGLIGNLNAGGPVGTQVILEANVTR
jgi:hypothetical protein